MEDNKDKYRQSIDDLFDEIQKEARSAVKAERAKLEEEKAKMREKKSRPVMPRENFERTSINPSSNEQSGNAVNKNVKLDNFLSSEAFMRSLNEENIRLRKIKKEQQEQKKLEEQRAKEEAEARAKQEAAEKERLERERLEKERLEKEKIEAELKRHREEKEKQIEQIKREAEIVQERHRQQEEILKQEKLETEKLRKMLKDEEEKRVQLQQEMLEEEKRKRLAFEKEKAEKEMEQRKYLEEEKRKLEEERNKLEEEKRHKLEVQKMEDEQKEAILKKQQKEAYEKVKKENEEHFKKLEEERNKEMEEQIRLNKEEREKQQIERDKFEEEKRLFEEQKMQMSKNQAQMQMNSLNPENIDENGNSQNLQTNNVVFEADNSKPKKSRDDYDLMPIKKQNKFLSFIMAFVLLITGGIGSGLIALKIGIMTGFFDVLIEKPVIPPTPPVDPDDKPIQSILTSDSKKEFTNIVSVHAGFSYNGETLVDRWSNEDEYVIDNFDLADPFIIYQIKNQIFKSLVPAIEKTGLSQESFDKFLTVLRDIDKHFPEFNWDSIFDTTDPNNPTVQINVGSVMELISKLMVYVFEFITVLESLGLDNDVVASFMYFLIQEFFDTFSLQRDELIKHLNKLYYDRSIEPSKFAALSIFVQISPEVSRQYKLLGYTTVKDYLKQVIVFLKVQAKYGISSFITLLNQIKNGEINRGDALSAYLRGAIKEFQKLQDPRTGNIFELPKEIFTFFNDVANIVNIVEVVIPGFDESNIPSDGQFESEAQIMAFYYKMVKDVAKRIPIALENITDIINKSFITFIGLMEGCSELDKIKDGEVVEEGAASVMVDLISNKERWKDFGQFEMYTMAKIVKAALDVKGGLSDRYIDEFFLDLYNLIELINYIAMLVNDGGNPDAAILQKLVDVDIIGLYDKFQQIKYFSKIIANAPFVKNQSELNYVENLTEKYARSYYTEVYSRVYRSASGNELLNYDDLPVGVSKYIITDNGLELVNPNIKDEVYNGPLLGNWIKEYTQESLKDLYREYYYSFKAGFKDIFKKISTYDQPISAQIFISWISTGAAIGSFIAVLPIFAPIAIAMVIGMAVLMIPFVIIDALLGTNYINDMPNMLFGILHNFVTTWFGFFGVDISELLKSLGVV